LSPRTESSGQRQSAAVPHRRGSIFGSNRHNSLSQAARRVAEVLHPRRMSSLAIRGTVSGWSRLIVAVEEALRLGVTDAAAVLHILHMPDPEERRRYAIALTEELAEFERPMPVMDEYDLLLNDA